MPGLSEVADGTKAVVLAGIPATQIEVLDSPGPQATRGDDRPTQSGLASRTHRLPACAVADRCLSVIPLFVTKVAEIETLPPGGVPGIETIGIIAGNRSLPLIFAREARKQGVKRVVAVAFDGETDPGLAALVDDIVWIKVGQLSKMISAFTDRGVKQCIMAGQIAPRNLYEVRPDLRAVGVLLRLKVKNAHTVFGAIADELKKDGVELIEATPWFKPLMPGVGFQMGPKVSDEQQSDIEIGFRLAKEITRLEIGQTVVLKDGAILAVEAFEGTDRCLTRGGELAGRDGGAVAVKVAREKHDLRFDIPCLGPQTIETCAAARVSVLAFEAGKSLLLEQETCAALTKKNKISLLTIA